MTSKEIYNFMLQLQAELASEYERIQEHVLEDPGTAGDQAEENWAALLRNWLPANYPVVTKGRIINIEGVTSPQVDILVLNPAYPKHLINKKHYLAGGVVAAFECKLTLRTQHISKAFSNCAETKKLVDKRKGTPYKELTQPILFGVLAHSHSWSNDDWKTAISVVQKITDRQFSGPQHPSEFVDIFCISNLGTYALEKTLNIKPGNSDIGNDDPEDVEGYNHIVTSYTCSWNEEKSHMRGTVLGAFVACLMNKLAYEDPTLRSIANYYRQAMESGGIGLTTVWYPDILSESVVEHLETHGTSEDDWSEWATHQ